VTSATYSKTHNYIPYNLLPTGVSGYPKVSGLAGWSENYNDTALCH